MAHSLKTPVDDLEDADPGLARERTELAWTRTAISFAALGSVIMKRSPLAGALVLAFSVPIWEIGRVPRVFGGKRGQVWRFRLITATITGISAGALMLAYLGG